MTSGAILNSRPASYRARFHEAFGVLGWPILDCPVLIAEQVSAFLPPPADFDGVIFTSQIAVNLFPAVSWKGKKALAVGPGTAEAARAVGFTDVVQTGNDADDLSRHIAGAAYKKLLYPSAEEITADLAKEFPDRVNRIVTYRMKPAEALPADIAAAAQKHNHLIAPLFSKRSATALADLLKRAGIRGQITAVGISAEVFAPESGPWQRRAVAAEPTLEGVAAETRRIIGEMAGHRSVQE